MSRDTTGSRYTMKVVAFKGSARTDGNTAVLVNTMLAELKREGIETELVQLAGTAVRGVPPEDGASQTRTGAAPAETISSTTVSRRCRTWTGSSSPRRHIMTMSPPRWRPSSTGPASWQRRTATCSGARSGHRSSRSGEPGPSMRSIPWTISFLSAGWSSPAHHTGISAWGGTWPGGRDDTEGL